MEFIKLWTMQVAGAVIFGILFEMLAPDGKMKNYIRIALGLILVIAVINPFMEVSDSELLLGELNFLGQVGQAGGVTSFEEEIEMLESKNMVIRSYKKRLAAEINTNLAKISDCGIDVKPEIFSEVNSGDDVVFGDITDILVILTPNENTDIEKVKSDVIAVLMNDFGVKRENIRFWRDDFAGI